MRDPAAGFGDDDVDVRAVSEPDGHDRDGVRDGWASGRIRVGVRGGDE